jgi:hypothetical protein
MITPKVDPSEVLLESFDLDFNKEAIDPKDAEIKLYSEAVFENGKEKLKHAEGIMYNIKKELDQQIALAKNDKKKFDPKDFWRNKLWKEFEDELVRVFNFRSVYVSPYIEEYIKKDDEFESRDINAFTYTIDRYPIDALITNKGLYDKSKSIILEMYISLGLIRTASAPQIIAAILHEIGHNIDPALVSISYTGTNVLCKYLTNRNPVLKPCEVKSLNLNKDDSNVSKLSKFVKALHIVSKNIKKKTSFAVRSIFNPFKKLKEFMDKIKRRHLESLIRTLEDKVKNDDAQFNYQEYTEAFADNFVRMYGYGKHLASFLKMCNDDQINYINKFNWNKREILREEVITEIAIAMVNDEHKTDIHRIKALIREYDKDLKDPNISNAVKKHLKEDKKSCEDLLYEIVNNKDEFYKRINTLILNAIEENDAHYKDKEYNEGQYKDDTKDSNKNDERKDKSINES